MYFQSEFLIFFSRSSLLLRINQLLRKITSLSLIYLGLYFYLWSRNLSQCFKFAFVYRVGVKEFYNMFYRVVHYGFFTFFFQNLRDGDGGDDLRVVGALHP